MKYLQDSFKRNKVSYLAFVGVFLLITFYYVIVKFDLFFTKGYADNRPPAISSASVEFSSKSFVAVDTDLLFKRRPVIEEDVTSLLEDEVIQLSSVSNDYSYLDEVTEDNVYDKLPRDSSKTVKVINRDMLERLVMGEAGVEGFVGQILVAQCIRDTMLLYDMYDTDKVRTKFKYSGRLHEEPKDSVKQAVAFVFDHGGSAVESRLNYFYAPDHVKGGVSIWHETQEYILTYRGHKFFNEISPE